MAQIPANPSVDVESLKPFKKFIMTIGNLPTSYLESLTYAELVMWFCNYLQETVIPTVNNNGGAVEELQNLYIELKNYVDNYFTDLDVQEEINNKLDEMASDGTLINLISNYIDPFIEEQNEEINSFKNVVNNQISIINNKVDNVASGSPLLASNVSEMTDTNRIYVNTSDGNWYYYNGTTWQIGGTYQSTGISNQSIDLTKLTNDVYNTPLYGNLAFYNITPGYINSSGSIINPTTNKEYVTGYIDVSDCKFIIIDYHLLDETNRWFGIGLYDENQEFINRYSPNIGTSNIIKYNIPDGIKYIRYSYRTLDLVKCYLSTDKKMIETQSPIFKWYDFKCLIIKEPYLKSITVNAENNNQKDLTFSCGSLKIISDNFVYSDLTDKEFTISVAKNFSENVNSTFYVYYNFLTTQISTRQVALSTWENTYNNNLLLGIINVKTGEIYFPGYNINLDINNNLCGIVNGYSDTRFPEVKNGKLYLSGDTILIDNNFKNSGGTNNYFILNDATEINIASGSSISKIYYLKFLNKVVSVKYTDSTYTDAETGIVYYLNKHNTLLIAIIRTTSGCMSINCPYIWNGKYFGLINMYPNSEYMYNKNVKGIAHRGYSSIAPENTLPAYQLARQKGFEYVETDISFTSDGVPVCLHDNTINRTARNSDGSTISETININQITYNDLLNYDFGIWKGQEYADTKIPTFNEFIGLCRNLGLHPYIELKSNGNYSENQIQSLINIVKSYGMTDRVTWISFSYLYLTYVKNYDEKARIGYVVGDINNTIITSTLNLKTNENEVFIDADYSVDNEEINLCYTNNIPLEVWTVDNENTILTLNPYITGITSDQYIAGEVLYNSNIS